MKMIHSHDDDSMVDLDNVDTIEFPEDDKDNEFGIRLCFKNNGGSVVWNYKTKSDRSKAWDLIKKVTGSICIDINALTL